VVFVSNPDDWRSISKTEAILGLALQKYLALDRTYIRLRNHANETTEFCYGTYESVFVVIDGVRYYHWRAIDQDNPVQLQNR
jgi:hypothetical protein